ncbi:MAG: hypothetical protein AAGB19_17590, partial [Cyanobacteria bacterium P01_F01_bin.3]
MLTFTLVKQPHTRYFVMLVTEAYLVTKDALNNSFLFKKSQGEEIQRKGSCDEHFSYPEHRD